MSLSTTTASVSTALVSSVTSQEKEMLALETLVVPQTEVKLNLESNPARQAEVGESAYNWEDYTLAVEDLTPQVLKTIAYYAIPNIYDVSLPDQEDLYYGVYNRQIELVKFCKKHELQLVPLPERLTLVYDDRIEAQIPDCLVAAMYELNQYQCGTKFIGALNEEWYKPLTACPLDQISELSGTPLTPYNSTADHESIPQLWVSEVSSWLMIWVDKQLSKLTVEEKLQLAIILNPELKVEGSQLVVEGDNKSGLRLDFTTLEVEARLRRTAYQKLTFGKAIVDSTTVLFSLAQFVGSDSFEKHQINGTLNELPNLFEQDSNYGICPTKEQHDPTKVIRDASYLPIRFAVESQDNIGLQSFPWVVPMNDKFSLSIFDQLLDTGKAALIDKYGLKFAGDDTAANAALIGRALRDIKELGYGDYILTLHDAAKASKFFNRPIQARVHLKAEVEGREMSSFASLLPSGKVSRQSGKRMKTLLTNSLLTAGSGPAFVNPAMFLFVTVKKSQDMKVSYDRLTLEQRTAFEIQGGKAGDRAVGIAEFEKKVLELVQDVIDGGKSYNPGKVIISYEGIDLLTNKNMNQPVKILEVKKSKITSSTSKNHYQADYFTVTLKTGLCANEQWWKLRNDGLKLTTLPQEISFLRKDENGSLQYFNMDFDIMLNNETRKGDLCEIAMFIDAHKEHGLGVYDSNTATLTIKVKVGEEIVEKQIDLLDEENEVSAWVRANTKTISIELEMPKAEWDVMKQYPEMQSAKGLTVVQETEKTVLVREEIQCLEGYQYYEVEISTPRENNGFCGMTPEQIACLSLQNRRLAELINAESKDYRSAVKGLANMIAISTEELKKVPKLELNKVAVRKELAANIGDLTGVTDAKIVAKFEQLFPKGVVVSAMGQSATPTNLYINFGTIRGMTGFVGGSACDIAEELVAFLMYICSPDKSGVDSKIYSKICHMYKSFKSWLLKAAESKGVLKKATRTSKICITGKIRTSYATILHHEAGKELPKVALNPRCDMVRALAKLPNGKINPDYINEDGKFDVSLMNGMIVGAGRTPMPMLGAFQLVISNKVGIAHVLMLPYVWAMLTEGDSDGDGVFIINLTLRGVDFAEAVAMNNSIFGFGGYTLCYGKDPAGWPCADFSSVKDKYGKKSLLAKKKYVTAIPVANYKSSSYLVSGHYKKAVGISYGICSVLTFKTANLAYKESTSQSDQVTLALHKQATVISWRLLYEGLGLGGYSEKAKAFFDLLQIASWSFMPGDPRYTEVTKGEFGKVDKDTTVAVETKDCFTEMAKLVGITHLAGSKSLVRVLVSGEKIRHNRSAIEQGKARVARMAKNDYNNTVLFGALRAMGQGKDEGAQDELEALSSDYEEGEVLPRSLFSEVLKKEITSLLYCPWLKDLLQEASDIHTVTSKYVFRQSQQD